MKLILCIILFFLLITESGTTSDCFYAKSSSKCYTLYSDLTLTQPESRNYCRKKGGDLALITKNTTWDLVKNNFRTKLVLINTWLRPWVPKGYNYELSDAEGLTETSFWTKSRFRREYYKSLCMYIYKSSYCDLQDCSNNLPFLCEYNVVGCNLSNVVVPYANFDSCRSNKTVEHNSSVEIKCWHGYHLEDRKNNAIICNNGSWQLPKCIAGCSPPGKRQNAKLVSNNERYFKIGQRVVYVCNEGYFNRRDFSKTHFILTCQEHNTWTEEDSYCSKNEFATNTIDINDYQDQKVTLNCPLASNDVNWIRLAHKVDEELDAEVLPSGNLRFKSITNGSDGLYYCEGKINNTLHIGSVFYQLVDGSECNLMDNHILREVEYDEGQNVLMECPKEMKSHMVKWYKDDQEIDKFNQNTVILPNNGLFLRNVQFSDEGIYKCEVAAKNETRICKYNATYNLTIVASESSICGIPLQNNITQPWLVILQQEDEITPFCYGTLITSKWVVTSAFCLSSLRRKKKIKGVFMEVRPGDKHRKYNVQSIKVHPEYRSQLYANNIGLVKLQTPVKFCNELLPACMGEINFMKRENCDVNHAEVNGTVSGWGSLLVDDMQKMKFAVENETLVSEEKCHQFFGFTSDMFCVKNAGEKDTYAGDCGSPFTAEFKGRKYLLGVFNWGERITHTGKYDYFTSIFHHYKWIKQVINNY